MNPATTSGQALQNLQSFNQTLQSPTQAFQKAGEQLGVPQAQQQVSGLRQAITNTTNLLSQVAPSVYGRTGNSMVTQAQATHQIGNESAPIQQNLGKLNTDYGNANSDYSNLRQEAEAIGQADLGQQQSQQSYLQQVYQNLYGQEQDVAKQAEAIREFNVQQAAAKAAGSGLSLGGGDGGSGGGAGNSTTTARNPADITFDVLKNAQAGKLGWSGAAQYLKSKGINVSRGSAGDIALNRYFNAAGFNDYLNSLKAQGLV